MMGNPLTMGSKLCRILEEKKEGGTSSPPLTLLCAIGQYGMKALLSGPYINVLILRVECVPPAFSVRTEDIA